MLTVIVVLFVAAIVESIAVAYLGGGLKELSGIKTISLSEIWRIFLEIVTNGKIMFGVFLEALFFFTLCYMFSQKDVSLVWPLTSMGFIVTTVSAKLILGERVSTLRWIGISLIAIGAVLTSYSEHVKEQAAKAANLASVRHL